MMTLAELFAQLTGKTVIQKEEHCQSLVGCEIEIVGRIGEIYSNLIGLRGIVDLPPDATIDVSHDGKLRQQLLTLAKHDVVKLAARLRYVDFGSHTRMEFDLSSIAKQA
jgi:hypothetical protein